MGENHLKLCRVCKNTGAFNGCEVLIENSVTRVTVRHHEACRVMPNSCPKWRNFQFAQNTHDGFFFLHIFPSTIALKLEYAKITVFFIKKCSVRFLPKTLMSKCLAENDVKNWCCDVKTDVKRMTWHHARESSYTPSYKTTFPSPSRGNSVSPRIQMSLKLNVRTSSSDSNFWKSLNTCRKV